MVLDVPLISNILKMTRILSSNYSNNNDIDNEGVSKEESDNGEVIIRGALKKGPWTLSEDIMLREYVMKYGEGNWNSVQKNSMLARCGKSCRLRWANHLKPNLKKGAFSKEEEQIIVQLHANLGNKWARMAAQLPGRTDNEIKNFWNTRVKRYQRAGLPLYPPEVVFEATLYHQQQHQNSLTQPYTSSPFPLSSFISSATDNNCHKPNDQTFLSSNIRQNQPSSSYYTNLLYSQLKFPNETNSNGNMSLSSLSPVSPYGSSSSSSLFNQSGFVTNNNNNNNSHDYYHHSNGNYNNNNNNNVAMPNSPLYESLPLMQSSNTEASLSQSSPPSSTTPTSSYANSGVYGFMGGGGASSTKAYNNCYEVVAPLSSPHQGNSGFLDEPNVTEDNSKSKYSTTTSKELLSRKRKSTETEGSSSKKEEDTVLLDPTNKKDGSTSNKIQRVDSKSFQFSAENTQVIEDGLEGINSMDDDLFGLLKNFQEIPIPDWYHREGQSLGTETQRDASLGSTDQEFAVHGNFWRNMSNKF